jgi:hypothetical protein
MHNTLTGRTVKCAAAKLALGALVMLALQFASLASPSHARAEEVLDAIFPAGVRIPECSPEVRGRDFTVRGPGWVMVLIRYSPYNGARAMFSPISPDGTADNFGRGLPLPAKYFQWARSWIHDRWTDAEDFGDGDSLTQQVLYVLDEPGTYPIAVRARPPCNDIAGPGYEQWNTAISVEIISGQGEPPQESDEPPAGATPPVTGSPPVSPPPGETPPSETPPVSPGPEEKIAEIWNTSNCDLTDTATLALERPAYVTRIEVWYRWQGNETSVAYDLSRNGQSIRSGNFGRAECDPSAREWCIGTDLIDANLAPGVYAIHTESAGICKNDQSGGQGFIRVFGSAASGPSDEEPQAPPPPPPVSVLGTATVAGTWDTGEGLLTLTQDGAAVSGTYTHDEGRIEGTLSGNVLDGYWGEKDSDRDCGSERLGTRHWGRIHWTFAGDGFAGQWGYCEDEPTQSWNGTRQH